MAITPYLYYEDLDAALKWLAKAFGFKPYGTRMKGPDGKTSHAAMKLGEGIVMMGRPPDRSYKNPKRLGQATQSLYVGIENVERHFERARKAGASVLEEPQDTEYGHRRYGVCDPEGHEWYFAQELKPRRRKRATGRPGGVSPRRRRG
jgi:uncharacterized glyoxalase superfamily protein PhnB